MDKRKVIDMYRKEVCTGEKIAELLLLERGQYISIKNLFGTMLAI